MTYERKKKLKTALEGKRRKLLFDEKCTMHKFHWIWRYFTIYDRNESLYSCLNLLSKSLSLKCKVFRVWQNSTKTRACNCKGDSSVWNVWKEGIKSRGHLPYSADKRSDGLSSWNTYMEHTHGTQCKYPDFSYCLTNRFPVVLRLFSNKSQMSKCGKNSSVVHWMKYYSLGYHG